MGPDVIDIRKLYGQTGKFTYDPGFMSTASCNSAITYIDGDKGELLYRGYPIEQLAQNCDFLETCYLLLNGELPNAAQKKDFVDTVTKHTMVHEQMQFFLRGFRRDAHPMAVLVAGRRAVGVLPRLARHQRPEHREVSAIRLIAKMPTLVAMAYKYSIGQPFMYPKNDLSYSANFMRMMFANPCEEYKVNPCSSARWTASSSCTPTTSRTPRPRPCAWPARRAPTRSRHRAAACLWGPAHGGANEAA
jgi:citrate synthase